MGLLKLSLRNALRVRARALLTILAVAASLLGFVLLRAVGAGWTEQVRQTPIDRVVTRHRMGWGRRMPLAHVQAIGSLPGVDTVWGVRWASLVHPRDPRLSFDSMALEAAPFIAVHDELAAPAEQRQAFVAERTGAFVSRELAEELGWQLGARLRFRMAEVPGEIELTLSGIFESRRRGFAGRALFLHWEYYDEQLPESLRNSVHMIVARVHEPGESARIARTIDLRFEAHENQTFSQEDQATIAQLVARFGAVLQALDLVSVLILGVVMLILGNTVALGVRERTKEYATLRALGFPSRHVAWFILVEAALLGVLGGLACLGVAYPTIEKGLGRFLQETAGFPPIHLSASSAVATLLMGALLGGCAAALPAYQMSRSNIVTALRKVG